MSHNITIEKIPHSGALVLRTYINERHFVRRTYYFYTKSEASAEFRAEIREIKRDLYRA